MRWYTADTHFLHANIARYEPTRPENFIAIYLENWRSRVSPHDDVFFLGDLVFGSKARREEMAKEIASLPGNKIFIRGNHDRRLKDRFLLDCGFQAICPVLYFQSDTKWLLSHYPLTCADDRVFEEVSEIRSAFELTGAVLNVHGHLHSKVSPDHRCVCVSVEQTGFAPVSEVEIKGLLTRQEVLRYAQGR